MRPTVIFAARIALMFTACLQLHPLIMFITLFETIAEVLKSVVACETSGFGDGGNIS